MPGMYTCDNGQCIKFELVCNGYNDCTTGDDELSCGTCASTNVSPTINLSLTPTVPLFTDWQFFLILSVTNETPTCTYHLQKLQLSIASRERMIFLLLLSFYKHLITLSLPYVSGINECLNATLNKCNPPTACRNTVTSYKCECPPGYRLNKDDKRTCQGENKESLRNRENNWKVYWK